MNKKIRGLEKDKKCSKVSIFKEKVQYKSGGSVRPHVKPQVKRKC